MLVRNGLYSKMHSFYSGVRFAQTSLRVVNSDKTCRKPNRIKTSFCTRPWLSVQPHGLWSPASQVGIRPQSVNVFTWQPLSAADLFLKMMYNVICSIKEVKKWKKMSFAKTFEINRHQIFYALKRGQVKQLATAFVACDLVTVSGHNFRYSK